MIAALLLGLAIATVDCSPSSASIPWLRSGQQKPITAWHPQQPFKAGEFTVRRQNSSICATYGEAQWTGTVDVTDERRLFFWFTESRNDPSNDPIILWLNGGPGGSSMIGMMTEMGPCRVDADDATTTVPNEWAWNRNASVLFIDQPAGTGFSTIASQQAAPTTDLDGAVDFQTFLNIFFEGAFPDKAALPIHFAAESYGGHFAPVYMKHMLDSRAYNSPSAFRGNISSIILVDALTDWSSTFPGTYELLCTEHRGEHILNATACAAMAKHIPECERLGKVCDMAYDGHACLAMMEYCSANVANWYIYEVAQGRRHPWNVRLKCPEDPPYCTSVFMSGVEEYLNQMRVKDALGFPASFEYKAHSFAISEAYNDNGEAFRPTTRQLAAVLDAGIRLLVLNGNDDWLLNTPGQMLQYDRLLWGGLADYRVAKWRDLGPEGVAADGFWKGTPDGSMVFVGVDGAGHTAPGDVREGSWRIVQRWIEGGWKA